MRTIPPITRWRRRSAVVASATLAAAILSACGGGGYVDQPPLSCSVADQKTWLGSYMNDWYYWYAISPNPSPSGYASVDSYFNALLYTGTDATNFPKQDTWSYISDTADFNRVFGEGKTLGYGLKVAGHEVEGHPEWPLYVRYVEPGSPAANAGLVRGDQVLTLNGRTAASIIAANDYSALSPADAGQGLTVVVNNTDGNFTAAISSAVYALAPVPNTSVVTSPSGRKVGYIMVNDMLNQALTPMDAAFAQFKSAGVNDVVIDLRYNGGGLVSVAASLASLPRASASGNVVASLLYNDKQSSHNQSYRFQSYANALGLSKVYVLTGSRTCSASELLINGLRPYVNVVTVGDTTCGKPVGFLPQDDGCGNTFSVVNFESVNALNQGRYFDGFEATCAVAEDWTVPLGATSEPLLATALEHVDTGACPPTAAASLRQQRPLGLKPGTQRSHWLEPGERQGMLAR